MQHLDEISLKSHVGIVRVEWVESVQRNMDFADF
jgi:hypothetical protein